MHLKWCSFVGILPMNISCEPTGLTFYCFGSYSVFLTTQDWRTHMFWTQQITRQQWRVYTHVHIVLHSSFVPWGIVLFTIINNKKHNLSQ